MPCGDAGHFCFSEIIRRKIMKKFLFALVLIAVMLFAAACTQGDSTGNENGGENGGGSSTGEGEGSAYDDYLISKENPTYIITNDVGGVKLLGGLYDFLCDNINKDTMLYQTDRVKDRGHEILVGETNRDLSAVAYEKLSEIKKDNSLDVSYVIVSEGNSIAIAYEKGFSRLALKMAVSEILGGMLGDKTELKLEDGVLKAETISVLDYYTAEDEKYDDAAWGALKEHLGEENVQLYNAIRDMYGVYDPKIVLWLAGLYSHEVGGFYYSNSAKNTEGYAPDIESTCQALSFIPRSGMAYLNGNAYNQVLPREMLDDIGNYVKSLQDPNGYFYNYQWTKESHGTSRLSRDLSSALGILSYCGMQPTYNTPTGQKGDGKVVPLPEGAKTASLSSRSLTHMVSKVVAAATPAEIIQSKETLVAHLESMKANIGKMGWYGIGHNVNTMMDQIKQRDKVLRTEFYDDPANQNKSYSSLVDAVIKFFNENQNPVTGHWEDEDGYLAVNGILKISGVYRAAGAEMQYHEKLVTAAFNAVVNKDEELTGVVDVYNAWSAVSGVIGNLKNYGASKMIGGVSYTAEERVTMLREYVWSNAVDAVRATKEKLSVFKKSDYGFSYNPDSSAHHSQGMPVAIPRSAEGDVNASELAVNATSRAMFSALGLSDYYVNVFGARELVLFMAELEKNKK